MTMALNFRFSSDVAQPSAARYRGQATENCCAVIGYWGDSFGGDVLFDVHPEKSKTGTTTKRGMASGSVQIGVRFIVQHLTFGHST